MHPARNSDPHSSHAAAEHITLNGVRAAQQAKTAAAVKQHPGLTSLELSRAAGIDRYVLARRLSEVEADGLVHRGAERRCSLSGRLALTWWPGPVPAVEPQRVPVSPEPMGAVA